MNTYKVTLQATRTVMVDAKTKRQLTRKMRNGLAECDLGGWHVKGVKFAGYLDTVPQVQHAEASGVVRMAELRTA